MLKRNVLWWMILLQLASERMVSVSMSIAIVAMVDNQGTIDASQEENNTVVCPNMSLFLRDIIKNEDKMVSNSFETRKLQWSRAEQNMVLSGTLWLSAFSMLPGGVLSHKYGSKRVVGFTTFFGCVLSSLIPLVSEYGAMTVAWIRAAQGFLLYMAAPAGMFSIIGNWSPPQERGKFGATFMVGLSLSAALGDFVFGYICQYTHWKYVFHLTSICGIIWSVFWYRLVYDSPAQHPSITPEEVQRIKESLKTSAQKTRASIPWKEILCSGPFIICMLATNAGMWSFVMSGMYTPIYLKYIYGMKPKEIGIITSVPSVLVSVLAVGIAFLCDLLVKRGHLSITNVRKICSCIGGLSCVAMVIIAFTKCNLNLVVGCLLFSTVVGAFGNFGAAIGAVDLSPKFSGVLEGISLTSSAIQMFVFSSAINYFTKILEIEDLWKMAFLFTGLYCILTHAAFLVFGTLEVQPWNFTDELETRGRRSGELKSKALL